MRLVAGTYTIQIEDNNGCSYSASETITQPTVLVVSQGNVTNVSCFGGNNGSLSVNASGATAPYHRILSMEEILANFKYI